MAQSKIIRALDPRETGDVIKFFETFDGILEKNSGIHDCKCLTNDAFDPPCPLKAGGFTKIKLTDDAVHITNIDKSFISARVAFVLRLDFPNSGNFSFTFPTLYEIPAIGSLMLFVGFKSAIHFIDAYRIYCSGKKTQLEQTEALYENAVTYYLKPQQEVCNRPCTYSPWENVAQASRNVCGVYIPFTDLKYTLSDFSEGYKKAVFEAQTINIEFDINVPFDDFLPLSGMTMFPNCLFGNMVMELKQTIQNNLVYCQVPFQAAEEYKRTTLSKSETQHTNRPVPYFTQINDNMPLRYCEKALKGDVVEVNPRQVQMILTCQRGDLLSCRSNINGFNIKQSVLDALLEAYSEKELIIPAQMVDYQAFSQTVQPGGLKCNTTYSLTNVTNVILTFPRTGNQITVSKNPNFGSIQLQIEGKPYPDKPFSTLETSHTEFNLVNANLDSIWAPNRALAYSLTGPDYNDRRDRTEAREDDTNYCLNFSTERLCGAGAFCDGLTKQSAHINLNATNIDTTTSNPYLYPDGTTKNDVAPLMMIVQDCFWKCTTKKGAEWIANNPSFYEDQTGTD